MTRLIFIWRNVCLFLGVLPTEGPRLGEVVSPVIAIAPTWASGEAGFFTADVTVSGNSAFFYPVPADEYWEVYHIRMQLDGSGVDIVRLNVGPSGSAVPVVVQTAAIDLLYNFPTPLPLPPGSGFGPTGGNYVSDQVCTAKVWRVRWRVEPLPSS